MGVCLFLVRCAENKFDAPKISSMRYEFLYDAPEMRSASGRCHHPHRMQSLGLVPCSYSIHSLIHSEKRKQFTAYFFCFFTVFCETFWIWSLKSLMGKTICLTFLLWRKITLPDYRIDKDSMVIFQTLFLLSSVFSMFKMKQMIDKVHYYYYYYYYYYY